MTRTIIVLICFVIGLVYEIQQIISFEKKDKYNKDEEYIKLYRKCHWTYLLIFIAAAADRVVDLLQSLS